jgi:hypothetical protein
VAIIPIYSEIDKRTGKVNWGLGWNDFHKVRSGYGCPACLEDFCGVYMPVCPVCRHERDVWADFLATPAHFQPGVAGPAPDPM